MKGTKVAIAICSKCQNGIYSVARYDFHYCPCESTYVDGGFDYYRVGWDYEKCPRKIFLVLPQSKKQLYDDWNQLEVDRKYGILNAKKLRQLYKKQFKKTLRLVASKSGGTKTTIYRKK